MQLNEILIRQIIRNYQEDNQNELHTKQFLEQTCLFIQRWPKLQFRCDDDICQDFLLYIIQSISKIMDGFPLDTEVLFKTWFSSVLYNKFADLAKKGVVSVQHSLLDEDEVGSSCTIQNRSLISNSVCDLYQLIQKMPIEDASFIIFYYYPYELMSNHLQVIAQSTNKDLHSVLLCYQELMNLQNVNYHKQEYCYQKLQAIDHRLAHMENMHKKNDNSEEALENKIARFKNKRYKYTCYLKRINQGSMKIFAQLFNDYNTAYRKMKKLERQIKQLLLK